MRLDKYIGNLWFWSRKIVTNYIKEWLVEVNWKQITDKDYEIKFSDLISILEDTIEYREFIYIVLNKPKLYVSSRRFEAWYQSYLNLIEDCPYKEIIDIVWRLDFDTEWLLLLTNDWDLTHKIIQPKKDIFKKYYVKSELPLNEKDINSLKSWVKIDDFITKEAIIEKISENEIYLSISEWKFHQIKKMLEAVWNQVIELKRISIANLELWNLEIWKWRYLSDLEIEKLKEKVKKWF